MITYHVGRPPRAPRRQRAVRVMSQCARYATGYAFVAWSCFWIVDVHLLVPGLVFAAMVANPWRPKRPVRPAHAGSGSRAVHSRSWRTSPRRAGLLSAPLPRT